MIHVLSVFGTRPEAIKMAPVLCELRKRPQIRSRVCVTAQHREMLDQVLRVFDIRPDYDLNLMHPGQSLSDITSGVLHSLEHVLEEEQPDLLLVHGDTSSCFASALAAFYAQIPIAHVEAGLRSGDPQHPFPEEINRQLTDRLCTLLFAPTERSRENLLREGIPDSKITVTGNTIIDAMAASVRESFSHPALDGLATSDRLLLVTAHRRENIGEPLRHIFRAVRRLSMVFDDLVILCPLHKNPAVRAAAYEILSGCERICLIEPPDVITFHNLLARCFFVLTDSGGIQEEAAALHRPVLVLRDCTERQEGVLSGALRLIGTEEEAIFQEAQRLLTDPQAYESMCQAANPFGDGHASIRIADAIEAYASTPCHDD